MDKKKKDYWGKEEDELILEWKTASVPRQTYIYNKLYPKVDYMYTGISSKYFSVKSHDSEELKIDTINHLFVNLNTYNPEFKSYSYCGTIMKNYIKTFYAAKIAVRQIDQESVEDISKYENIADYSNDNYNGIDTLIEKLKKIKKDLIEAKPAKYEKTVSILNLSIEFVEKFGMSECSIHNMAEYVKNNSNFVADAIQKAYIKIFGIGFAFRTDRDGDKIGKRETYRSKLSYIQDDYCPYNFDYYRKLKRKRIIRFSDETELKKILKKK